MLMSTRSTDAGPWAPWRTTGIVSATVRWVCLLCWVVGAAAGAVQAAVGDSAAAKLRAAIRLPEVSLDFRFGFTQVQEWHGDDDVPDPDAEVASLRMKLTGRPTDAVLLLRIAQLTGMTGDDARRKAAYMAALEATRAWVASAPGEAAAQRTLAALLAKDGKYDEAERMLKALTGDDSKDAAAFAVLCQVEEWRATTAWLRDPLKGLPTLITGKEGLPLEDVTIARRHYALAMRAIDRAVQLEPLEARHLTARVRVRAMQAMTEAAANPAPEPEQRAMRLTTAIFPGAAIPDLEAAARLRPDDARIQTALLLHLAAPQLTSLMSAYQGKDSPVDFVRRLPAESQERIRTIILKLERLGESTDPRVASHALESLAFAKGMLSFNTPEIYRYASRAFERDPRREAAFDMALAGCVTASVPDWGNAERLVRARARVRDDARLQLLLVKVLDLRGNGQEAHETVRRARARHADSAELQAAELLLLVKRPDLQPGADIDGLSDAMLKRFQAMPDGDPKMRLSRQFFCYSVIRAALNGELDEARRRVREALAQNPGDDYLADLDRVLREVAGN